MKKLIPSLAFVFLLCAHQVRAQKPDTMITTTHSLFQEKTEMGYNRPGQKHGPYVVTHLSKGYIKEKGTYQNDLRQGIRVAYNEVGDTILHEKFKDDHLDGYSFRTTGIMGAIMNVKHGKLHGEILLLEKYDPHVELRKKMLNPSCYITPETIKCGGKLWKVWKRSFYNEGKEITGQEWKARDTTAEPALEFKLPA
jgi:hypothetical protein